MIIELTEEQKLSIARYESMYRFVNRAINKKIELHAEMIKSLGEHATCKGCGNPHWPHCLYEGNWGSEDDWKDTH